MADISVSQNEYLFGKGRIAVLERDASGGVSKALFTGNAPELKISASTENLTHFESETGLNGLDRDIPKTVSAEVSMTLENVSRDNLALMWWSQPLTQAQQAAQSYFFPSGIVAGETHVIPDGFNIANLVIKDSAGVPATVPTTKYNWNNAYGVVEFLDVTGFTQPFEAEFDQGQIHDVPLIVTGRPVRFIRFHGVNIGNPGMANQEFLVELYKVTINLPEDFSLIGDDIAQFPVKGSAQLDETRQANSLLGGYGRIRKIGALYTP